MVNDSNLNLRSWSTRGLSTVDTLLILEPMHLLICEWSFTVIQLYYLYVWFWMNSKT